jgi:hypothetical protein
MIHGMNTLIVAEIQAKYLEATVRNQNYIHEEIKSRLNSGESFVSISAI